MGPNNFSCRNLFCVAAGLLAWWLAECSVRLIIPAVIWRVRGSGGRCARARACVCVCACVCGCGWMRGWLGWVRGWVGGFVGGRSARACTVRLPFSCRIELELLSALLRRHQPELYAHFERLNHPSHHVRRPPAHGAHARGERGVPAEGSLHAHARTHTRTRSKYGTCRVRAARLLISFGAHSLCVCASVRAFACKCGWVWVWAWVWVWVWV